MKRSSQVPATLIVALAAGISVSGCSNSVNQCVDAMGNVIPDTSCRSGVSGAHWIRRVQSGGFGGSHSAGGFFGG